MKTFSFDTTEIYENFFTGLKLCNFAYKQLRKIDTF